MSTIFKVMRVCVVGAGANGLATAKALLDQGFHVTVFEQLDNLGGMWRYNADPNGFSPCYETLTTNTPKRLTAFQDLPMPDSYPTYPHHVHMLSYIESYAERFNLKQFIHFNNTVTQITKQAKWFVTRTIRTGDIQKSVSEEFDAVSICIGHHWKGRSVCIPNQDVFGGSIIHSCQYRQSSTWKGKKVLIEGLGVSGREILTDLLPVAKQIIGCSSRDVVDLPADVKEKIKLCKPIKQFTGPKSVEFKDGTTEDDVDGVISCRGYLIHVPFLDMNEFCKFEENYQIINLYQRIISPKEPSLAFIGFVTTYGSLHPIAEVQAKYFASTLAGLCSAPSPVEMDKEIMNWRNSICETYRPMNVDYWEYIGQITKLLPKANYRKEKTSGSIAKKIREITSLSVTPTHVTVASIQAPSILGNVESNTKRFTELITTAAKNGAKFIVLPEAAIPGYVSQDLMKCWHIPGRKLAVSPVENQSGDMRSNQQRFEPKDNLEQVAEPIPGPSTEYFGKLAKELQVYLVIPLIEKVPREKKETADASFFKPHPWIFYNACVLLSPEGTLVGHYRKNNLWGCVDNAWCTAGTDTCVVDTEYGRVGMAICFDVHVMFERYKSEDIWTLLYPIAWVDRDIETWFTIDLPERISKCNYNVVGANWSVDDPTVACAWRGYGYSTIYSKDGTILSSAKKLFGSEIIYANLPTRPNTKQMPSAQTHSTDLLTLEGEPDWTQRSKSNEQRFTGKFSLPVNRLEGKSVELVLEQGGDAEHLGMTVWDGGIVLGKYFEYLIHQSKLQLHGRNIIELGSGTGILGMILSCFGANVTFSDINDPPLLQLLLKNIQRNKKNFSGVAQVVPIDWCAVLPDNIPKDVGMIVAADVIYSSELVEPLVNTLDKLCDEHCTVYISYEMHHLASVKEFFQKAKTIFTIEHIAACDLHPQYQCGGIGVKRMRKINFVEKEPTGPSNAPLLKQLLDLQCRREQLMKDMSYVDEQIKNVLRKLVGTGTGLPVPSLHTEEFGSVTKPPPVEAVLELSELKERIETRPGADALIEKKIAFKCHCDPPCALLCKHRAFD